MKKTLTLQQTAIMYYGMYGNQIITQDNVNEFKQSIWNAVDNNQLTTEQARKIYSKLGL